MLKYSSQLFSIKCVIKIKKPFCFAFFIGLNPITLYIGHTITMGLFPWAWTLLHPTHWSVLAMNLWTTTLWGIIAYWLYWKDIIISI